LLRAGTRGIGLAERDRVMRLPLRTFVGFALLLTATPMSRAEPFELLRATALAFTGSVAQIEGDVAADATGAAFVYSRPDGAVLRLEFARVDRAGGIVLERTLGAPGINHYQPSLCWDGTHYAVAASTFTQSIFLVLDAAGDTVMGPIALPGLPLGEGHRTAALRVRCTPAGYAVFGLLAEREDPVSEYYYGHLHYWLVNQAGAIVADRDLRVVQPLHYPEEGGGSLGFERTYYDAVWTGASFFVAYGSESATGPPLSVYYETIDLAGDVLRAEMPAFATTVAIGPVLATDGSSVALTALRSDALVGNFVYLRRFAADGNPLDTEVLLSPLQGPLGTPPTPYGPTVAWDGDEYVAVYAEPAFPSLGYQLQFQHVAADGTPTQRYLLHDTSGAIVRDPTQAIGIDLQMVASGRRLLGKTQTSNFITNAPVLFALPEPGGMGIAALAALAARRCRLGRRRTGASASSAAARHTARGSIHTWREHARTVPAASRSAVSVSCRRPSLASRQAITA
jgi:hypothetical protein